MLEKHAKMFYSGGSDMFFAGGIYIILFNLFTLWIWIADASTTPLPSQRVTWPLPEAWKGSSNDKCLWRLPDHLLYAWSSHCKVGAIEGKNHPENSFFFWKSISIADLNIIIYHLKGVFTVCGQNFYPILTST